MMHGIDADRFLSDLRALRRIGAYRSGVHRPTYSAEDMAARHWLVAELSSLGLDAVLDGIGSVFGRQRGAGPYLLAGSHLETQNHAGWLDGALGVVAALALARAGLPVDVAAFADEEGHYGSFLGSRSAIGLLEEAEIDRARNRQHGTPLREALAAAGLAGRARGRLNPARYRGFLELHIEQGTELEAAGHRAGIVTGIVAIWQYRMTIKGIQDHAGSTTMAERKDAGLTAVRLLARVDREFPMLCGPRTVWTCGRISLEPGAPSIIPGSAELLFQMRDLDVEVLRRMEACLERIVQEMNRTERTRTALVVMSRSEPATCDAALQDALAGAAERHAPGQWQHMPSGAGHDAQYMARVMPSAMLFAPSIGGISHHWSEDTKEEDLVLALRILADAASALLAR